MPTIHPEQLHADTVTAVRSWLRDRANHALHGPGQWSNPAIRDRMIAVIEGTAIRSHRIGHITATTPDTADGCAWHYIARDALRVAADRMNIRDPHTEQLDPHTYRLTWQ